METSVLELEILLGWIEVSSFQHLDVESIDWDLHGTDTKCRFVFFHCNLQQLLVIHLIIPFCDYSGQLVNQLLQSKYFPVNNTSVREYWKILFYPPNTDTGTFYGGSTDIDTDAKYQKFNTDVLVFPVFYVLNH